MSIVKKRGVALLQVKQTANKYGMKVNPDSEHVFNIIEKIYNNDGYCPCMPMKNDATKCPCRYMREMKACRCGLYVRCDDAESSD